ncbi:MAG: hypothetical protein CSA42_01540 [Gammaproteobacteria bacterium]|nr:MAG: hypothetical protein CSA42_01540 [Gammaproteobacteria bacterium]
MMHIVFFLFAMLMPWLLGFIIIKLFLKRRSGSLFFAIGAGYVLGWFIVTIILRVYNYFHRTFDIYEIVLVEFMIVFLLMLVLSKQIQYSAGDFRLSTSRICYYLSGFILFLFAYRWGLTAVDLLIKPVFPWDGWLSWSAKAKIFYYYKSIPSLVHGQYPFWQLDNGEVSVYASHHPYFISLVQTYSAMAWGSWNDGIVNLAWLGASISMASTVLGAVLYLSGRLLPAILASYAVVSLPIFDTHASLGSYADLWVGLIFLISICLFVMSLIHKEWKLFLLSLLYFTIMFFTKNTALFLVAILFCFIIWYQWGSVFIFGLLLVCISFWGIVSSGWLNNEWFNFISKILFSGFNSEMIAYNPVIADVWREWIVLDNWHYLFLASLVSMILFLLYKKGTGNNSFFFIIVLCFFSILIILIVTFLTIKMSGSGFVGYFNRVSLYFIPVFALTSVSVYCLNEGEYMEQMH